VPYGESASSDLVRVRSFGIRGQTDMQALPGFRDFYPDDCARRNYILTSWREVARRYGFVEFDGPTVESLAL
jgi:histidyl-tRNA synthetase